MNFKIRANKCITGEHFFSLFFPEENNIYYNDNDIIKKLGLTQNEYQRRLERSFKVVKTDDEIYIKDNISEEEMTKKFKEEFYEELTILKLKDFNQF